MTERQARHEGLRFTGVYERFYNSDNAKRRAAEIRKQFKCRAVMVKADNGVSVYADEVYFVRSQAASNSLRLARISNKKEAARKAYEEALAKIDEEKAALQAWFDENKEDLDY